MDELLLKSVIVAIAGFGLLLMYTEFFDNLIANFKKKSKSKTD